MSHHIDHRIMSHHADYPITVTVIEPDYQPHRPIEIAITMFPMRAITRLSLSEARVLRDALSAVLDSEVQP